MAFIRKIRKGKTIYLALVQNKRENGKIKQKVIKYLGKEIEEGKICKKVYPTELEIEGVKRYGDILVIDKLCRDLQLHEMFERYTSEILLLVYSHLLEGVSISNIEAWMQQTHIPKLLGMEGVSTKRIYHALDYLSQLEFSVIEERIYERFKGMKYNHEAVLLDVTDTYFTGEYATEAKPRRGKDGKYNKLLQISLAIHRLNGFPIFHKIYEGNVSNIYILRDMAYLLKQKGIRDFIIIDRGMSSRGNIEFLRQLDMSAICGLVRTKELENVIDCMNREEIYHYNNRIPLINTTVYGIEIPYLQGRLLVIYNPQMELVRRELLYEKGESTEKAKYLGYSFLYTTTELQKEQVVKLYFQRDRIERSFRQLKGVLHLRPIRLWLKHHVKAHIRICYLAYSILSLLEYNLQPLKISAINALNELKDSYIVAIKDSKNQITWQKICTNKSQEKILNKLNVVYKI